MVHSYLSQQLVSEDGKEETAKISQKQETKKTDWYTLFYAYDNFDWEGFYEKHPAWEVAIEGGIAGFTAICCLFVVVMIPVWFIPDTKTPLGVDWLASYIISYVALGAVGMLWVQSMKTLRKYNTLRKQLQNEPEVMKRRREMLVEAREWAEKACSKLADLSTEGLA
jgi:hypothetical protein